MTHSNYKNIRIKFSKRVVIYALSFVSIIIKALLSCKKKSDQVIVIEPYGMGDVISLLPLIENLKIGNVITFLYKKTMA